MSLSASSPACSSTALALLKGASPRHPRACPQQQGLLLQQHLSKGPCARMGNSPFEAFDHQQLISQAPEPTCSPPVLVTLSTDKPFIVSCYSLSSLLPSCQSPHPCSKHFGGEATGRLHQLQQSLLKHSVKNPWASISHMPGKSGAEVFAKHGH